MANIADLEDVVHQFVEEQISFTVIYPSEDSAVISVESQSITNEALHVLVDMGASLGADNQLRILFTPEQ